MTEALLDGIAQELPRKRYNPPAKNLKMPPTPFSSTILDYFRSTSPNTTKPPHQHRLSYQSEHSIWLDYGLEGLFARNSEILLPRAFELIFRHATWPFSFHLTNSVQTTAPGSTHGPNKTIDMV